MPAKRTKTPSEIRVVRAYDISRSARGYRVLVDRLWPRGVVKDDLALDEWARELAPSTMLRRWFNHQPERWAEFRERYFRELDASETALKELLDRAKRRTLLLVYGARDAERNNAVALRDYLRSHSARRPRATRKSG